jgi:hypothetical protein
MANRCYALAAVIGSGLLLNACVATPAYPLMTPIQVAKNYGYFDQPIDDTHWVVSYVTPEQSSYGFRYDQAPAEAQARHLAQDLALWRASQVAQAHGYSGFEVTDRRTSVDAVNVEEYYGDPFLDDGFGFRHRHYAGTLAWSGPGGPAWYEPPEGSLQVEAKIKITLTQAPRPDDFRADDMINRLRAAYPGAETGAPHAPTVLPAT